MYETLRIEQRDRIAVLYFNRPDKLNALNRQVYVELGRYLESIESGEAIADVLVLTGEGRAFVAGADIDDYLTMTLAEFSAFQRLGYLGRAKAVSVWPAAISTSWRPSTITVLAAPQNLPGS